MKMTVVERIKALAREQGRSQAFLCEKIGMKGRTYFTDIEKHGRDIPRNKLETIAEILGVSCDYLLGKTTDRARQKSPAQPTLSTTPINEKEARLLFAYRSQPQMQSAVDKILGIENSETVLVYTAANSDDNRPPKLESITKEHWEAIKNAPETDEELL